MIACVEVLDKILWAEFFGFVFVLTDDFDAVEIVFLEWRKECLVGVCGDFCWLGEVSEHDLYGCLCECLLVEVVENVGVVEGSEEVCFGEDVVVDEVCNDCFLFFVSHGRLSSSLSVWRTAGVISVVVEMVISRVRPYLPLLMTFALMMPSMSSSEMTSEMRRWVNGLSPMRSQRFW